MTTVIKRDFICEHAKLSKTSLKYNYTLAKYIIEIHLSSNILDVARDFANSNIFIDFISMFNNSDIFTIKDSKDISNFVNDNYERYIIMPFVVNTETLSLLFLYSISNIIDATEFNNYNGKVCVDSVKVYENNTDLSSEASIAYAGDINNYSFINYSLDQIIFSKYITDKCMLIYLWDDLIKFTREYTKRPFSITKC